VTLSFLASGPQIASWVCSGRISWPTLAVMTMNPVEVERKVRQLDNEVQAIYEMLAGIEGTQRRHSNRFEEIAVRLDEVDQKFTVRFNTLEGRFDTVEGRFDTLEGRFDTLEGRFDTLEGKVDRVLEVLQGGPSGSA
jgi:predicted nuclease with TOPRIM domain